MNYTRNCSTCNKPIDVYAIKYHTADKQNVFCNAYCSNEWYQKKKENKNET